MNSKGVIIIVLLALIGIAAYNCAFIVDEREQVVVTRFSKVNRTVIDPGLNFKIPVIEQTIYYPKNLQEWDGDQDEIPTADKTYIWVDTFARWKISNPVIFFQKVRFIEDAEDNLNAILDAAVRNFITSNRLIDAVRSSNRELDTFETEVVDENQTDEITYRTVTLGRSEIMKGILEQAKPKLENFGIQLEFVKIKRINYREDVRRSVYDRMIAERKRIAEKFRSEGKGEAQKILGDKERELKQITSEAYKTAQEIKGKADAEATKIYANAYGIDPEFYSFIQTLEIYNQALDDKSSLVLSTDSELLKYLKGYKK